MAKKSKVIYGTGCLESKLDGTEYQFEEQSMSIPPEYSYLGLMPPVLNQGKTYKCVCYSLTSYLDWRKNAYEGDNNGGQYDIDKLFSIRADKSAPGMSIKEALHYLRHTGLNGTTIDEYAMVGSVMQAQCALILNGPLVGGLPVYENSQDSCFWQKNGRFLGGHCITIIGYNRDGFIIRNSWGDKWCRRGHVLMPYDEFSNFFEVWTMI